MRQQAQLLRIGLVHALKTCATAGRPANVFRSDWNLVSFLAGRFGTCADVCIRFVAVDVVIEEMSVVNRRLDGTARAGYGKKQDEDRTHDLS